MNENDISREIIGSAIEVHKILGPGLLESTYEHCLSYELESRGFKVWRQVKQPLVYKTQKLELGYRLDLLINDKVIVELKAVEAIHPVHQAQLLTYLKLSNKKLGLLLNFNVSRLTDGVKRMVNGL